MAEQEKERFLSRWARLKQRTREQETTQQDSPLPRSEADAPPELPPLEELNLDSDYGGFFHPKVDENLRRAALKRLFNDPHFNIMDGLDVYIDDYSKPNPLPAEMLATLRQAQKILDWAKEGKEEEKEQEKIQQPVAVPGENAPALQASSGDVAGVAADSEHAAEPVKADRPIRPEPKS
jgi:hypothetical protein